MYGLGLEQAGHEITGFCEIDERCRKVLKKHWPTKPSSSSIEFLNKALMALSGVSPVKIYQSLAKKAGYNGTPPLMPSPVRDCSGRWCRPFAWYDRSTGLWRTWQSCLLEGWGRYSERWPAAGMMQNGIAWEREPLAHPIIAPEYTFLPTIVASEGKGSSRQRYKGSPNTQLGKMSAGLRISKDDGIYLDPTFAENIMGLPKDFTLLETETPHASLESSRKE